MSDTGFFAGGLCHATREQALTTVCDSYRNTFLGADGVVLAVRCSPQPTGDVWLATYRNGAIAGWQNVLQYTPSCSLEQPELFPLPSATDIGTVFAWGFSLVLLSYLTAWGLGTVLNFLKRN